MTTDIHVVLWYFNPILYAELDNKELPEGGYAPGLTLTGAPTYIRYQDLVKAVGLEKAKELPEVQRLMDALTVLDR